MGEIGLRYSPHRPLTFWSCVQEEAVKTYTHILQEIDNGSLPLFETAVPPPIALAYWKLRTSRHSLTADLWQILIQRFDSIHCFNIETSSPFHPTGS